MKAEDALGQLVEHLKRAGEWNNLWQIPVGDLEEQIFAEIDAEPRGKDTDDAYEQSVDDQMGCV